MTDTEKKLAAQEQMKRESHYLKGHIAEELADQSRGDVTNETYELLKFHGTYFGHDRDTATERKKAKQDPDYEFMTRLRVPGGRITAAQYLGMDKVAEDYANATLRMTTRQTLQFHVIKKENLQAAIADMNRAGLSTQSACGDVVRNITVTAAPIKDAKHARLWQDTQQIAEFVKPKTTAYGELFCSGGDKNASKSEDSIKRVVAADDGASVEKSESALSLSHGGGQKSEAGDNIKEVEPLYGATYLPRKFKIGIITPEDNSIDVFTHDLGFVQIWEGETLLGYNVLVGGGLGCKHEAGKVDKKTYPRVADVLCFVAEPDLLNAVEAVVKLQRDHGDRTNRQHARLKYVVQEQGLDWIRTEFTTYFAATNPSAPETEAKTVTQYHTPSHMGWHEQGDGKLYLGLPVPSGRVVDYDTPHPSGYTNHLSDHVSQAQYRTALKAIFEQYGMNAVLTPTEEIILCDIDPSQKAELEALLATHHIRLAEAHSKMELNFMTCVALPTCAKALAESERVQFPVVDAIQAALEKHDLGNENIAVRMTGCPNGCARPYVGDIGIVGRMPGHYVLFIGGDFEGTRLNTKVLDKVPEAHIATALDPMFALFAANKNAEEGFGDFCTRYGIDQVVDHTIAELAPQEFKWAARV